MAYNQGGRVLPFLLHEIPDGESGDQNEQDGRLWT
jgi:hypothetical protein